MELGLRLRRHRGFNQSGHIRDIDIVILREGSHLFT